VLWHAYPVIGIDDRNQWGYYRDVEGLADLVAALHDAGIKVFVDYNPWDVGMHRGGEGESTLPLARLVDHPLSWAQWSADSPCPASSGRTSTSGAT